MKVGITGIGSPLARKLAGALSGDPSVEVIKALDVNDVGATLGEKVTFFKGDIRNEEVVGQFLDGIDVLFHLAFVVKPTRIVPREEAIDINVNGTRTVFDAAARRGVGKIIYTSSVAAYGMTPDTPEVLREDSPRMGKQMPRFIYGYTKALVEEFIDTFESNNPRVIVTRFRPHVIAGPCYATQTRNLDIIINPLLSKHKTIVTTKPVNSDSLILQLTHESDLIKVFGHSLNHDMSGAYNIAGEPVIFDDLAASKGKNVWYVPFGAVDVAARVAGRLSARHHSSREWLQALKYQCVVNCDKLARSGALKEPVPTRAIIEELIQLKTASS